MPLRKIVTNAIVASTKGKVAGRAAANAAEKKAAAAKAAKAKKAAAAKAAKANAKGLKAAQGPSLAPKGYTADEARRAAMITAKGMSLDPKTLLFPRQYVDELARLQKAMYAPGPVNIVSKSGRVANTPKLKKQAAKKAK